MRFLHTVWIAVVLVAAARRTLRDRSGGRPCV